MYLSDGLSLRMNIPICAFDPEVKPKAIIQKSWHGWQGLRKGTLILSPRGWHGQKPTRELRCSLRRNLVLPSIRKVRISRSPDEAGIALIWRLVSSSQWQIKKSSVLGWGRITFLGRPIDYLGRFLILFIMVLLVFVTAYQLSMIDTWLFFSSLHFL